jgi:hypothetical protein
MYQYNRKIGTVDLKKRKYILLSAHVIKVIPFDPTIPMYYYYFKFDRDDLEICNLDTPTAKPVQYDDLSQAVNPFLDSLDN